MADVDRQNKENGQDTATEIDVTTGKAQCGWRMLKCRLPALTTTIDSNTWDQERLTTHSAQIYDNSAIQSIDEGRAQRWATSSRWGRWWSVVLPLLLHVVSVETLLFCL